MENCTLTSDEDYSSVFPILTNFHKDNKKNDLKKQVSEYLPLSSDPYRMVIVWIKLFPGLFTSKSNSFSANILVELEKYIDQGNNKEKFSHCLTQDLQVKAHEIALHQKNVGVTRLFVRCFQLANIKNLLLPFLKRELKTDLKRVSLMAALLGVQSQFSTSELILPMFLANHLADGDEFLVSSPSHQRELVLLLDGLLEEKEESSPSESEQAEAKNVKNMRDPKVICDTIGKLLKRFELNSSICPHFLKHRAIGGLRFMFYKYYTAKDMPVAAFYSLIDDTVQQHPDILPALLKLFVRYDDFGGAIYYIAKLNISEDDTPDIVKEHMTLFPELLEESKASLNQGKLRQDADEGAIIGYSVTISDEDIVLVDKIEEFEKCTNLLKSSPVLGVDAEWKPTFGAEPVEQVALLQFATDAKVFLIDLILLQPSLQDTHWRSIGKLFANSDILKLGYGIKNDFQIMSKLHEEMRKGITSATNVRDLHITKGLLLDRCPQVFLYSEEKHKGLSDLVYRCFGQHLDKREAFSNWAARPLNRSQIIYAAADVRCLIDVYNHLNIKAKEFGITDWISMAKEESSGEKKKSKPPSKEEQNEVPRQDRLPIGASDFSVICDTMLQGLAKKLRSCGVDAKALENGECWDRCYWYYEREKRTVLTRGKNYHSLIKHIPEKFVYSVKNEPVQEQLEEVIQAFSVKITMKDLFARCIKCNSKDYIMVASSVLRAMQSGGTSDSEGVSGWVECERGSVNVSSGMTESGVRVLYEAVPAPVVDNKDLFYICSTCGKCYWEGSHHNKVLCGRLKNLVVEDNDKQDGEKNASDSKTINSVG